MILLHEHFMRFLRIPRRASNRIEALIFVVIALNTVWLLASPAQSPSAHSSLAKSLKPLPPQRNLAFDHYSLQEGLSQSSVFAVLQDHYGFLWFGTQDGLNRYDGYRFTVYRRNPQNPRSLPSNFVSALYEDRQGRLWIGLQDGGLSLFDRRTETFVNYQANPNIPFSSKAIASNFVRGITEDADGTIWVATIGALSGFNTRTGEWRHITGSAAPQIAANPNNPPNSTNAPNTNNTNNSPLLSSPNIISLLHDEKGGLWAGTLGNGLNYFQPQSEAVRQIHRQSSPQRIAGQNVTALYKDKAGNLWVGTEYGVDVLYGNGQKSEHISLESVLNIHGVVNGGHGVGNQGENPVRAFMQENDSLMWIGVEFGGLIVYNTRSGKMQCYRHEQTKQTSLSNDYLWCIFRDRQGSFWVGTQGGGANVYNPFARKFTTYGQEINNPYSLSNNFVRAICEDGSGRLWVGTEGGGLSCLDRATGRFSAYTVNPKSGNGNGNGNTIAHNIVKALVYDARRDALWIGTNGGLNKLDLKSGRFTLIKSDKTNPNALNDDIVRALLINDDGTLWVGTETGGASLFDPETKQFRAFVNNPNDASSLSFNTILTFYRDFSGVLWVGTLRGLNKYHPESGKFTVFAANPAKPDALQSGNIRSIHEDGKGRFWIGTWGGGLHLFDRTTGQCKVFREKDGLPNDAVYGVLEDSSGHLWLTTNAGLARFNPETQAFRTYTVEDGLQSNEFNGGAFFQGAKGRLYVGGVSGLSEFCPRNIVDNTTPPPVVITGFKKFNKAVHLALDLNSEPEIVLPYDDNFFTIEYAALSFINAGKNNYLYKMDGFDRQWVDAGTSREAVYTNLDPGKYVFHVKACNNDGFWNEQGARLRITVLPPWWMTVWFRAGIFLGFVGTGGAWFLMRWRRERKQREELERLVHIRTEQLEASNNELSEANEEIHAHIRTLSEQSWEIATMNTQLQSRNEELERLNTEKNEFLGIAAHDLKNPLSSIVLLSEMIQMRHQDLDSEQLLEKVGKIESTAMRMRDIITNLLDVNALESGVLALYPAEFDAADIIRDVVQEYSDRASEKGISLYCEVPEHLHTGIYADYAKTHEVLENLVSNAVKYSPHGKNVWVRICGHSPLATGHWPRADESANAPMTNAPMTNAPMTNAPITNDFLRVEIQDEGPGISDEDMKRLFGKFARLSAQPTGGEHSTGLGLSIVKKIVEAMNGKVWCESVLGKGATFVVMLPKALP